MGSMPHRLAKGPIGLRLDYLSQFQSVRLDVYTRLSEFVSQGVPNNVAHDGHPANVLSEIRAMGHKIGVVTDSKKDFVGKINYLDQNENLTFAQIGVTSGSVGAQYIEDDRANPILNQDSSGNLTKFADFWMARLTTDPLLFKKIAEKILIALDHRQKIEFWWDCTLEHGGDVEVVLFDRIARVFFRTNHAETVTKEKPDDKRRGTVEEPPDSGYVLRPEDVP